VQGLGNDISTLGMSCGRSSDQYIEIDIDKTKYKKKGDIISDDA